MFVGESVELSAGRDCSEKRLQTGANVLPTLIGFRVCVRWRGKQRTLLSGSPLNRRRIGCETVGGELQDSKSCRRIDTSNRLDARSPGAGFRTTKDPAVSVQIWGESFLGRLLTQVFKENLPLFAWQELVVARERVEQDLRIAVIRSEEHT